ncbi:hypothetical protein XENOCAPTIV_005063 [Xenoophorus captivus]|uniref:Kinesin motor domain-containing protein n=1 Tax=Xenoophorus captivus TaxID=1517983 RepID=A0ABV0RK55_9TELE
MISTNLGWASSPYLAEVFVFTLKEKNMKDIMLGYQEEQRSNKYKQSPTGFTGVCLIFRRSGAAMDDNSLSCSNVKVAVRVRPMNRREKDLKTKCVVEMEGKQTILHPAISNVNKGDPSWPHHAYTGCTVCAATIIPVWKKSKGISHGCVQVDGNACIQTSPNWLKQFNLNMAFTLL